VILKKDVEVTQKKSKYQIQQESMLAELDAQDSSVAVDEGTSSPDTQEFKKLYDESLSLRKFEVGQIVKGKIVDIDDDYVVVDVNYKSEGLVPKSEFQGTQGLSVELGQEVEVYIDSIENENGMMVLSKNRADIVRAWDDISQVAKNQKIIEGVVITKMKGGLQVDIGGVKAFLPGSQIELRPVKDLNQYIGKTYSFKIIRFNQKRGNIVLSRRVILEEERENLRTQTLGDIDKGAIVNGIVKNITDYGAFLDLGGIDGLLHITDISWSRIQHPSEKVQVGETVKVKVLKFDREKNRVSLGLKQLHENESPWEQIGKTMKEGDLVKGQVTSLTNYGAFVAVDGGFEGLVHVSEMSWGKKVKDPSDFLKIGQKVDLKIIGVDSENQRISFSMKRIEENPFTDYIAKYKEGTSLDVTVLSVTDFGYVVELEKEVEGLVRFSDLTWSSRNYKKYSVGDKIQALVLGFSEEEERFNLGVKQLQKNPWEQIESKYPIGSVHQVKVIKIVDFGVFVELEDDGVEGLIHVSELSVNRVNKIEDILKLGDAIEAEIITMDKDSHKIGLSSKLVELRKEKQPQTVTTATEEEKREGFFAKALKASIGKKATQEKDSDQE